MRCSQNVKTSKTDSSLKTNKVITFKNDEDQTKFCEVLSKAIASDKVKEKTNKYGPKNRSFKVKLRIPELSNLGIVPDIVLQFKKVRGIPEYDLNIDLQKQELVDLKNIFVED